MGYSKKRIDRNGEPRYTACYLDVRGSLRSAGTYSNKKDAWCRRARMLVRRPMPLAALAAALRDRLSHATALAVTPGDRIACQDAAAAARQICQRMTRGNHGTVPR